jgi:general secretion pathway protein D
MGLRGAVDVDVLLSALSSTGRVRILSRPVILAQNNQEARILVGSERPFVQVFRSLPTDGATRDQIVQYRDVGTSLTILPTINPDGYVNLQLTQEVSTATAETQFGAPVISTREAATQLLARNGQTVVIGGLIDRQRDWTRSGIPVLKDIPLLGALFGSTHSIDSNSELFLFLTPHIVETDDDADRIRDEVQRSGVLERELGTIQPIVPPDTMIRR